MNKFKYLNLTNPPYFKRGERRSGNEIYN
jgi:hypothetical protein